MVVFGTSTLFFSSQALYTIVYRLLYQRFLLSHSYVHSTKTHLKYQCLGDVKMSTDHAVKIL
jgi:hypothetical protein